MPKIRFARKTVKVPVTVISGATIKPIAAHAFDPVAIRPLAEQWVLVHDLTLDAIGLRAKRPLDICSHYRIECDDRNLLLRSSKVRVTSCRRDADGMYDIGTEVCR